MFFLDFFGAQDFVEDLAGGPYRDKFLKIYTFENLI
jgi:hypothetical protein